MISKLEMFIALAREEHFGRAAESLGITQPTLSAGIRQLEDRLGVKLVLRGSRYGGLTPEGQLTLTRARKIVGDVRRLRDEMRFSREGLAGHVRLAVIPTSVTWAATLTSAFRDRHPRVHFSVVSKNSAEVVKMMENFDVDAGISYLDNEPLGHVSTQFLYRERYAVVCRRDHPLADAERLHWSDLKGIELCLLTGDMQNRRILNRLLADAGVEAAPVLESNSTLVLVNQVEMSGLVTVLPVELAAYAEAGRGLTIRYVDMDAPGHAVGLVAPYSEPHTPVLSELMHQARKIAEE